MLRRVIISLLRKYLLMLLSDWYPMAMRYSTETNFSPTEYHFQFPYFFRYSPSRIALCSCKVDTVRRFFVILFKRNDKDSSWQFMLDYYVNNFSFTDSV